MSSVDLRPITEANWREALTLEVAAEQQPFAAGVTPIAAIALAKAYIRPGGKTVEPFGIYHQDTLVGFFNLHYTPNSRDDFWLFHFFIDHRFQRQNFGRAAIVQLIQHLQEHHPSCALLRLSAHPRNDPAQRFCTRLGFSDDGMTTYDERAYSLEIPGTQVQGDAIR